MGRIRFFDDFAGIGGFRLALERIGWECVGSSEIDRHAREIYRSTFGGYPEHEDSTKIEGPVGEYDVYCAGFPCQDFSTAGKRDGVEGARGSMAYHVLRRIREDNPKGFILENVRGLLSVRGGKDFKRLVKDLHLLGYAVNWKVLNSKHYGVPQDRRRVYIIGLREDVHDPFIDGQIYFPKGYGHPPLKEVLQEEVPDKYFLSEKMVECLVNHSRRHGGNRGMRIADKDGSGGPITANYHKNPDDRLLQLSNNHPRGDEGGRSMRGHKGVAPTPGTNGDAVPTIYDDYNSRVRADGICGVVRQTCGHSAVRNGLKVMLPMSQGVLFRKLTPKECFRLQGFPDWVVEHAYERGISDTQLYRGVGNAVTVTVAEAIGRVVDEILKKR